MRGALFRFLPSMYSVRPLNGPLLNPYWSWASILVGHARPVGRAVLLPVRQLARIVVRVRDEGGVVQVPALNVQRQALERTALKPVLELGVDLMVPDLYRVAVAGRPQARERRRAELHDVLPRCPLVVLLDAGREAVTLVVEGDVRGLLRQVGERRAGVVRAPGLDAAVDDGAVQLDAEALDGSPGEHLAAQLHVGLDAAPVAAVAVHILRTQAIVNNGGGGSCVGVPHEAFHRLLLVDVGLELLLEERQRDVAAAVREVVLEREVDRVGLPRANGRVSARGAPRAVGGR